LLGVSEYFLWHRVEPFYSWFYCFAWWSYILIADNLLLVLAGRSLVVGRRRELARMLPLSVFIWLLFEAYNLVIRNWAYDGIPQQLWVRWPGYALAFATVLPGVFITADLAGVLLFRMRDSLPSECEPRDPGGAPLSRLSPVAGALLAAAPLVWPRIFFPAVWIGPILVADPLLERIGVRSLSLGIAAGDRRRIWSLLTGGFVCGLLWEFWNIWAASKWIYTVPFFASWKVFEMPLAGFLGFPPFALECWILYHLLERSLRSARSGAQQVVVWGTIALVSIAVFCGIDRRTVVRYSQIVSSDTTRGAPWPGR
jgi:hypothetical protein